MNHWTDSSALTDSQKELVQEIVNQIPTGIARAGFEQLLTTLAKGPFRYLVYSEGSIVGQSNDEDLIEHVHGNTDMEVFDLHDHECQHQLTDEDVGLDNDYEEDKDD